MRSPRAILWALTLTLAGGSLASAQVDPTDVPETNPNEGLTEPAATAPSVEDPDGTQPVPPAPQARRAVPMSRPEHETQCQDGMDDDGDGLVDCEDPDCEEKACGTQQACRAEACVCRFDIETECADGLDGDCDRLVDCEDPDCAGAAWCGVEADCADGVDDDFDGATDCADPGCATVGPCELFETTCGDRVDNDGDGRADCADPDCFLTACARPS